MRPVVLNVGCGPRGQTIPALFDGYEEVRMDIDATVEPAVLGSMTATGLPDCSVDAVFASHAVSYKHFRAHETGRNLVCRLLLAKKTRNDHSRTSSLPVS